MTSMSGIRNTGPAIPGYSWVRLLGSGGFADVHLYRQEIPAREVAIKILREDALGQHSVLLTREAHAMAALSGHPALVALHEYTTTASGVPYLVMDYCPVTNLGRQAAVEPLAVARVLDIMIRISGGVEMLHRAGFVHRDIKPSNVMIDAYGLPRLGDFGVAARVGEVATEDTDGFSLLWAAPEQHMAGCVAHPAVDVWALATTTWSLLAGRSPFEDAFGDNSMLALSARVHSGQISRLGRADAPPELEAILRGALCLRPQERPPSALDFGRGLQRIQQRMGLPVTAMDIHDAPMAQPQAGYVPAQMDLAVDADRTRVRAHRIEEAPAAGASAQGKGDVDDERRYTRVHPLAIAAIVVCAVLATAGLVVGMLTQSGSLQLGTATGGEAFAPTMPDEIGPVGNPPSAPQNLSGKIQDDRILWTWRHAGKDAKGTKKERKEESAATQSGESRASTGQSSAAQQGASQAGAGKESTNVPSSDDGVRFLYEVTRPGRDPLVGTTALNAFDSPAVPGKNCLELVARGEDGRQSESVSTCIEVPAAP